MKRFAQDLCAGPKYNRGIKAFSYLSQIEVLVMVGAMEIYMLLPKTNCKKCGLPTCMAFAVGLLGREKKVDECTPLIEEKKYEAKLKKLREVMAPIENASETGLIPSMWPRSPHALRWVWDQRAKRSSCEWKTEWWWPTTSKNAGASGRTRPSAMPALRPVRARP
jgi:hypothetical protein